MYVLWVFPIGWNPHWGVADRPVNTCGLLAPFCGSWKYGRVYHLHLTSLAVTVMLTLGTFAFCIWLQDRLVRGEYRRITFSRIQRRIRRGLCPKCGYDLRSRPSDSVVCPECGALAYAKSIQ
jgi:hypothetical protein